jgi:hypothetical protein
MKKPLLILSLFLSFSNSKGQNLPQCDSLVIQCCTFNALGPNTLTITVYNNSSYLFDYPNFVLFNPAMDTVAKETVTYFGIGTGPQQHTLDIITPITLPFNGILNLYALFCDSLCWSWPFYIPDTVTAISETGKDYSLNIYPNPSEGKFTVSLPNEISKAELKIYDVTGTFVLQQHLSSYHEMLDVNLNRGIYLLEISDADRRLYREKLVIR